jgi:hypothetical protein
MPSEKDAMNAAWTVLGPVPMRILNPREVGCQVDAEIVYVRGIAPDISMSLR